MKNTVLIILSFACLSVSAYGQISQKDIYSLLQSQAESLSAHSENHQRSSAMLDSAAVYAQDGLWEIANIFLEQYIEDTRVTQSSGVFQYNNFESSKSLEITLVSGVDFNRQEFELGYLQTDSVITDEISKPFLGIGLKKDLYESNSSNVYVNSDFRIDKENFSADLNFSSSFFSGNSNFMFEAGTAYDKNSAYPEYTFFETDSRQSLFWYISNKWEFRAENYLRYKKYDKPSEIINNFFNDVFRLNINYAGNYYLIYDLDYNESIDYSSNDYLEQTLFLQNISRIFGGRVISQAGMRNSDFSYLLDDSVMSNTSFSILADVDIYLLLTDKWIWKGEYHLKNKQFRKVSEQDADYVQHQIKSIFQNEVFNSLFLEAGWLYEVRRHDLINSEADIYIKEQNYYENGLIIGADYQNFSSLFISLSASYSFRRYPDILSDQVLSLYSSRNIFNLSLFLQLPIIDKFMFNLFAAYDNDQDLDNDEDKIRSSMFSAELQYRF